MTTTRKAINPVSWSTNLGFDQAQLIEGQQRQLFCSGQDAVDADGNPQHPGDMAAQLELALDNLETVLAAAVDRELDENAYIRPGLGDAGDRVFGTT